MAAAYRCEPLGKQHNRADFSCGNDQLDSYFHERIGQDHKRGVTRAYVLIEIATGTIAGYYTIAATAVDITVLPPDIARKLPRYPAVGAMLLGRLARDLRFRGRGIGELLLGNALQRCRRLSEEIGAFAVVVDAIDDAARTFYEQYGFSRFPEQEYRLLIPMSTIQQFFPTT